MMYARPVKERSICHDRRFLMTHVYRQAFARDLFAVHVQREVPEILRSEIVWVCIQRAEKVRVLYQGEEKTFRDRSQHGIVDR
jgi:hypothetical protein